MATWTEFYINIEHTQLVVEELKKLSNIDNTNSGEFPAELSDNYLFDENATPTFMAIAKLQPNWITVIHNSFNTLNAWSKVLSQNLDTKVIVTIAQSVSDSYYFSLFDKGQKLREIEVCYGGDIEPKNFGKRFDFENEQPGTKQEFDGEIEYCFDFESIEEYCSHFGLTIENDYKGIEWTILKSGVRQKTINDYLNTELNVSKKPWWKFW